MFVGTMWGQTEIADASTLSNDKAYVVQCHNGQWWTFNANVPTMMSNTQTAGQTAANDNPNQHFAFLKSGDKMYLYSIAAKKFVNKEGGGTKFVEYPEHTIGFLVAHENRQKAGYPHVVSLNGNHIGVSPGYSDQQGVITHYNDLNDGGNAIKIIECGAFASNDAMNKITLGLGAERNALLNEIAFYTARYNELENKDDQKAQTLKSSIDAASTESSSSTASEESLKNAGKAMKTAYAAAFFVKLSELESGVAYRFKNFRSERYLTVVTEEVAGVQIMDYSENINQMFYITKSSNDASYYNIQCCSGKYVAALNAWDVKVQDNACDFNIVDPDVEGFYKIRRTDKDHTEHNVGPNSGAIANGSPLYSNHGESNISCEWLIETVDLEKLKLGLIAKQATIAFEPVNAIGTCTATEEQKAKLDAGVASLNNLTALIEYDSMLDAILATSKPMTPGYYFLKGTGNGNNESWYMTHKINKDKHNTENKECLWADAPADGLTADYVWNFETADDGYKMQCTNLNAYFNLKTATDGGDNNTYLTVTAGDAKKLKLEDKGLAKYVIKDTESKVLRSEGSGQLNYWSGEGNETWYLIPASQVKITVGAAGWGTTYLPFDVTVPNTVKAYAVTGTNGEWATLTEKSDILANQGALLEGEGTHTFTIATANPDNWSDNLLKGTTVNSYVSVEDDKIAYVLANDEKGIGFYKAKLNFTVENGTATKVGEGGTHFLNNANKAYLVVEGSSAGSSAARFLSFDFGNETAIENIEGAENGANAVIYDLSGRRVQKAQKGLYIVNGVKVIK